MNGDQWQPPRAHETLLPDKALAILVMDHRRKFQGSWALSEWLFRHGGIARPEDIYPELEGYDVDAHFERLNRPGPIEDRFDPVKWRPGA